MIVMSIHLLLKWNHLVVSERRRVFSPKRQRITVYKNNKHFLQEKGETWQFLARNRHEKEEWVSAINVVIERLLRGQE